MSEMVAAKQIKTRIGPCSKQDAESADSVKAASVERSVGSHNQYRGSISENMASFHTAPCWVNIFTGHEESEKNTEKTIERLNKLEAKWNSQLDNIGVQVERMTNILNTLIQQARADMAR